MSKSLLSAPIFHDADKARKWLENRLWPDGPICPHCGVIGQATLMKGKTTRAGLYQCNACRDPFTVTVGTLYERSRVPLNTWLAATQLLMSSKKGMSSLQVGRMLGLSKKTAWFLCHRIRESLKPRSDQKLGGTGKIVEADETFFGKAAGKKKSPSAGGYAHKMAILSLAERGGKIRSVKIKSASAHEIKGAIREHVDPGSVLHTDGANYYKFPTMVSGHESVDHNKQFVRTNDDGVKVHTNTLEGYFGVFKRGMHGTYQHCQEKHLHRYLAEFDYRHNARESVGFNDAARMVASIPGIVGKRLTYQRLKGA